MFALKRNEFSLKLVCTGFLTNTAENLFKTLWGMQPRDTVDTTIGVLSKEDKVKTMIEDILDRLPEEFNIQELMSKVKVGSLLKKTYPEYHYKNLLKLLLILLT